ncbi:MAG TPA: hypothetical protein VK638_22305, partial [Edaphobacter sp.]|nr:hypothetical protein [Edaphobacter sp.]
MVWEKQPELLRLEDLGQFLCSWKVSSSDGVAHLCGGLEADPYFDHDGSTLYFISSRSTGSSSSADLDMWVARREQSGRWGKPVKLPEPVNSNYAEWFPRPASDGWLYFGSRRPGGFGKDDIWKARQSANG